MLRQLASRTLTQARNGGTTLLSAPKWGLAVQAGARYGVDPIIGQRAPMHSAPRVKIVENHTVEDFEDKDVMKNDEDDKNDEDGTRSSFDVAKRASGSRVASLNKTQIVVEDDVYNVVLKQRFIKGDEGWGQHVYSEEKVSIVGTYSDLEDANARALDCVNKPLQGSEMDIDNWQWKKFSGVSIEASDDNVEYVISVQKMKLERRLPWPKSVEDLPQEST